MLKVLVPNNNIPERQYIVDVLLTEFLGLEYSFESSERQNDWSIFLDNGSSIVIRDAFFSYHKEPLSYLAENNIPSNVEFCELAFSPEADMPVLFGEGGLSISQSSIFCDVDIFAGAFFMLTRWEEYVNKARDAHDRFPAAESLAFKYGFLARPVVNEYVELLWNLLVELGYEGTRKEVVFRLVPTHDVDHVFSPSVSMLQTISRSAKLALKKRSFFVFVDVLILKVLQRWGFAPDPCDTFDWLMDLSEAAGIKSRFYFMGGGTSKYDNNYVVTSEKVVKLADSIKKRGHVLGIHPSYNAFRDRQLLLLEKERVDVALNADVIEGRQHYLRFQAPFTWRVWDQCGMKVDSTCSFADHEGFRCGTGSSYTVFDFLSRVALSLKEQPLILMETSILSYQKELSFEEIQKRIQKLVSISKKYKFPFTFLWHNSSFLVETEKMKQLYLFILKQGH